MADDGAVGQGKATAPTAALHDFGRSVGLVIKACDDAAKGNGVFAGTDGEEGGGGGFAAGTPLFREAPVVGMQHTDNAVAVQACQHCFRPLGSLENQIRRLLATGDDPSTVALVPDALPHRCLSDGTPRGHEPVPCRNGCHPDVAFCNSECEAASFNSWHALLCDKGDKMPPATGCGAGDGDDGGGDGGGWLGPFYKHAQDTNETFLLAARAVSMVAYKLVQGESYDAAMQPFASLQRPVWWDAVSTPPDATPEEAAAMVADLEDMRTFASKSWTLLRDAFVDRFPVLAPYPLFESVDEYARLMGMFERNNCALVAPSVVEDYFLFMDDIDDPAAKAVTSPILDALDDRYCTPVDGTGLFPFQALLNHSCGPNVSFLKDDGDTDGRVVVSALTDISPGEELVHSYLDEGLPLEDRTEGLAGYGFVCSCPLCVLERSEGPQPGPGHEDDEDEDDEETGRK